MKTHDIAIIGGGASGLAAAIAAGQANPALRVILYEKNDRVGKKILASGNGRCNLSNLHMSAAFYHSQSPDFVARVLGLFGVRDAVGFFEQLGLRTTVEDGRVYPYSQRAASVLDVLRLSLKQVEVRTDTEIADLRDIPARKVIVATGGLAAPHTGSTGDGLRLLSQAGHTLRPTYPALTGLVAKHPMLSSLKGIRLKPCRITVGQADDVGEVLFTEYGLSGIPAMQVSGAISQQLPATAYLDLLPDWTQGQADDFVRERERAFGHFPKEDFFTGLFHKRVGQALLAQKSDNLAALVKHFPLTITGVRGYPHAQAMGGGCCLSQLDPVDMQSKLVSGLYAAGEVLDVYGDCGGYNLHWAWATGYLAGKGAALSCGR